MLRLTSDAPLAYLESESAFALSGSLNLMLGPDETMPGSIGHTSRDFQERTYDYWVEWCRYLSVPFEWQDAVIRAAIALITRLVRAESICIRHLPDFSWIAGSACRQRFIGNVEIV